MMSLLDREGKGSITKTEFLASFSGGGGAENEPRGGSNGQEHSPDVDGLFLHYDRNGDGKLTVAEIDGPENAMLRDALTRLGKAQVGVTRAELKRLFAQGLGSPPPEGDAGSPPPGAAGGRSRPSSPGGR